MPKPNKNTNNRPNDTQDMEAVVTGIKTQLPGVDSTKVIPSSPIFIKENSYKVKRSKVRLKTDLMSKPNKITKNRSNDTQDTEPLIKGIKTKLPGVDSTQVIHSSPDYIMENSYKVKKK